MLLDVLREYHRIKATGQAVNVNSLRAAFTGGAHVPKSLVEKLQKELNIRVQVF